jgi:hypothetical protein
LASQKLGFQITFGREPAQIDTPNGSTFAVLGK